MTEVSPADALPRDRTEKQSPRFALNFTSLPGSLHFVTKDEPALPTPLCGIHCLQLSCLNATHTRSIVSAFHHHAVNLASSISQRSPAAHAQQSYSSGSSSTSISSWILRCLSSLVISSTCFLALKCFSPIFSVLA